MNLKEPILYVGEEPEEKYAQKLKLLLAGLMRRSHAKEKPYIKIRENGCWDWLRYKNHRGYGCINVGGISQTSYLYFYGKLEGLIKRGLELDHLCRNKACCNPSHLEQVTHKENILRGESPSAKHAKQTHCMRGHQFTKKNTNKQFYKNRILRSCKKCKSLSDKKRHLLEKNNFDRKRK